jgi:hypothetical protein
MNEVVAKTRTETPMKPSLKRMRRNQPLSIEPLESIRLFSGISTFGLTRPAVAAISTIPLPHLVALNGSTAGTYTSESPVPDIGATYSVRTSGKLARLGRASVSGSLNSTGFIAQGRAGGTLLVTVPGGTLTLALTGPTQPGFSPLPTKFSYVITEGTGRFHNRAGKPVGKGTVDVVLDPVNLSVAGTGQGRVTLVFHAGAVVLE